MKVLILDDEDVIRNNLAAFLEDEDIDVTTSDSAENAYGMLDKKNPDFIVVDMRLPGMSGSDFIVKCNKTYPAIRYIIHTGSSHFMLSDALKKAGVTKEDVFIKPVSDMGKILARMLETIGEKQQ